MPIIPIIEKYFDILLNIFQNMFQNILTPKFRSREFSPLARFTDFAPLFFRPIVNNETFVLVSSPHQGNHDKYAFHLLTCKLQEANPNFVWLGGLETISTNMNIMSVASRTHQLWVVVEDWSDPQKRTRLQCFTLNRCASPPIELTDELELDPQIVAVDGNGPDVVVVQKDGRIHFYENKLSGTLSEKFQVYASSANSLVSTACIIAPGLNLLECRSQQGHGILISVKEGPSTGSPSANWFQYLYYPAVDSNWLLGQKTKWNNFPRNGGFSSIIFTGYKGEFKVYYINHGSPGLLELVHYQKSNNDLLDTFSFFNDFGPTSDWDIRSTDSPTTFEGICVGSQGIHCFSIDVDIDSSSKRFGISKSSSPYTQNPNESQCFFQVAKGLFDVVCSMNNTGTITLAGCSSWFRSMGDGDDSRLLMYGSPFAFR